MRLLGGSWDPVQHFGVAVPQATSSRALNRLFSTLLERIQSPNWRQRKFHPHRSARILCASTATSAALNLKLCNTNLDRVPSAESRVHFFLAHSYAPKQMSVSVSQQVRQSFNTRGAVLNPLLEFQSLTPIRTLARAVPCLRVTGTQIPIGVRGHGIRTSSFAWGISFSFCSFR
jgi:hypothetical protein